MLAWLGATFASAHNAAGIRITEMPITPEVVYRALRTAAGQPLEDD